MGQISNKTAQSGFSLFSLSVAILAVGLTVSAAVAGTQFYNQSQMKKFINETNSIKASMQAFRDKYGKWPGDFDKASTVFGCTSGVVPAGCDGTGDNYVAPRPSPVGQGHEVYRMWQHLSLAGMISGHYPGTVTVFNQADIGINVPASNAYNTGGYYSNSEQTFGYPVNKPDSLMLLFGSHLNGDRCWGPSLSASTIREVDQKMDDGIPQTGYMVGNCSTGYGASSEYTTGNTISCLPAFTVKR